MVAFFAFCFSMHVKLFWQRILSKIYMPPTSSYYVYITFLGYTALPFLGNTTIYLYPAAFFLVFYIIAVVLKWNLSVSVLSVYGITI